METTDEEHAAGLGKMANNNPAESSFGATSRQLQASGRIGLGAAGALGQAQQNNITERGWSKRARRAGTGKTIGLLHKLPPKMLSSLLTMAQEDAPYVRIRLRFDLKWQRDAKRRKEELARTHALAGATEAFIDALYLLEMFKSRACWTTAAAVDKELKLLASTVAKLRMLKDQIRMRVVGAGWADLATPWSKGGVDLTPAQLATHLKTII